MADDKVCPICQCDIEINDVTHLPCTHKFHSECCADYIRTKLVAKVDIDCPVCRHIHFKTNSIDYQYMISEMLVMNHKKEMVSPVISNHNNVVSETTNPTTVVINIPHSMQNASPKNNRLGYLHKYRLAIIIAVICLLMVLVLIITFM